MVPPELEIGWAPELVWMNITLSDRNQAKIPGLSSLSLVSVYRLCRLDLCMKYEMVSNTLLSN